MNALARQRRRFPLLDDDEWLRAALATASVAEVAVQVGCSPEAVRAAIRRLALAQEK